MTVHQARKIAEEYIEGMHLKIGGDILDDGEYFIFGYTKETDEPPIGVHKESGEVYDYFPQEHIKAYKNAKIVEAS